MRTETRTSLLPQSRTSRAGRTAVAAAALALLASTLSPAPVPAQEEGGAQASVAERAGQVVSMLDLAVTEYADAVSDGQVVNAAEYEETRQFTAEAGRLFQALREAGEKEAAPAVAARIDTLAALVERKGPAEEYRAVADRAMDALAEGWGAVTLPEPDRAPSVARGATLYRQQCASCHGATGVGDGPEAEGLEPPAADLTAGVRHTDITPARDYKVVTLGIPATSMAGYGGQLSAQERWDVVAYVQTLRFRGDQVAEGKSLALGTRERESPVAGHVRQWADPMAGAELTDEELAARVQARWNRGSEPGDGAGAGGAGNAAGAANPGGGEGLPATLTDDQAMAVVAYVRALMGTSSAGVP